MLCLEQVVTRQPWAPAHQISPRQLPIWSRWRWPNTKPMKLKRQTQVVREQLRAVIDASPEYALVADDHSGRILDANRQAEALTGRSREELLGLHHGMLYVTGQQQVASATATVNHLGSRSAPQ